MKEKMKPIEECLKDAYRIYRSNSPATTHSKLTRLEYFDEKKVFEEFERCYIHDVTSKGRDCVVTEDLEKKMRRIVDWLSTGLQPGLLLYGNLGTGKTALLRALYLLFSKYRHFSESVVMDSAASIVDAYGRYKAGDINSPGICYGDVLRADPLLIDELGCEPACKIFGTDYEPMCEILCRRYERRQVTVITTNLGDDLLLRTYGRRLWDRLNESYDMITFEGINFRTI